MALVTVAIPFYNAQRYLAEAIESVINQTYQDWNLILLDDGSTDDSLAIAKKYASTDDRISLLSDGENKNLGYRLNQISLEVKTKYLARMDADDIMHPNRLSRQIEILENNNEIDVLGTNAYIINLDSQVIGIRFLPIKNKIKSVEGFIHPTIMAKTNWFLNNPYDERAVRLEDFELWMRTKSENKFKMLLEPLLYYREFPNTYYKKYYKSFKTILYLTQKWKSFSIFKDIFIVPIKIVLYYFFEKILKSDYLFKRRNEMNFEIPIPLKDFDDERF